MGFGVRTGNPPDSGESAAADLKEQWNLRAHNSLARRGRDRRPDACERPALPTQDLVGRGARAPLRITEGPLRVTSAQKTRAKNARVDARERHLWVARKGGCWGSRF